MTKKSIETYVVVVCICIFVYLYICLFSSPLLAQAVIESQNYKVQMPNFNSGAGIPSSTNFKLDSSVGQTAPGLYSSAGFRIKSGFEYIHSIIPFSFSMSNHRINFGSLTLGSPSTLTSNLTVSAGGAGGYSVKVREATPLTKTGGQTIIDTTCDSGACTETTAGVWALTSTFGFGYNMAGDDVPVAFTDNTYYKQFANASGAEADQVVMSSAYVGRNRVSTITYKVNISALQPAGNYQNKILFTAIPSF